MAPVVGYLDTRGVAQPIRNLLHYVGQKFEDKRYALGPTKETLKDEWVKDMPSLGFDFPNIPYYIDGDLKITQTMAILRHLGRKHGLTQETDQEKLRVDLAEEQGSDILWAFVSITMNPDFEKLRPEYVKRLAPQLKEFSKFLRDRPFVGGDKISHADFFVYEALDQILYLEFNCLDNLPNLQAYVRRMQDLPNLKKYRSSEEFRHWPLFSHATYFGGNGPSPRPKDY